MRTPGRGGPDDDGDGPAPRRQGLEARIADTLVKHLVESGFSEALIEQVLVALRESPGLERLVVQILAEPGVNGSVDGMVDRQLARVLEALRTSDAVRDLVREQVDTYLQHLTQHPEVVRQLIQDQSRGMVREMLASLRAWALLADDSVEGWIGRPARKA